LDQKQDLKTGTTTVGIITENAVVLAADMRASMGHLAYDEEAQKIYEITERIAVTNAGSVGDSLTVIRFLKSHANLYEVERETMITPKALAAYLSNVLNANRYYPFIAQFILGGVNNEPELFEITPFGGILERKSYAVSGSGTELALSVLDQQYKTGLTENEGIALCVKAVSAAKKRDIYSGGVSISVMVIDQNGVRQIDDAKVKKFIENKAN